MSPFKAGSVDDAPYLRQRIIPCSVKFKSLPDKERPLFIHNYRPRVLVVHIAERGCARANAVAQFLAKAPPDVFREVVHIILGLTESDRQHKLALRCGVKPEGRELKGGYLAGIDEIHNHAPVNAVPRKAVRVPGNYALSLACLNSGDHVIEDFAARLLGGFAFNELAGDYEPFLFGVLAELGKLRLYGQDLAIRLVGGLSGIKKIPHAVI